MDPIETVMIAPYEANARLIERISRRVGKYYTLGVISTASAGSSFRGKEREIIFVGMNMTEKSGPSSITDKLSSARGRSRAIRTMRALTLPSL